jgi:hypothetical protein
MIYYICRYLTIDSIVNYLFFDTEIMTKRSADYTAATEMVLHGRVANAKLENTVIKAVDIPKSVQLSSSEMTKNSVYYIFSLDINMLYAVSNTGEVFGMTPNVAADFFKGKIILNGSIRGNKVYRESGSNYTAPLTRDYKHARTN